MKRRRNWLLFIIMVLLWGSSWAVMKIGLKIVTPLNFVSQRLLLATLALSPCLIYFRSKIPRDRNTWISLLVLALINAVCVAFTNMGLVYETAGIASVLTYTQPLFVFWLAVPLLKEEVNMRKILGVVLSFFGVTILYFGRSLSSTTISFPLLFLLLGAFLWAVTIVYYKKFLSHVNPVVTNVITFIVGGSCLYLLGIAIEGFSFSATSNYILIILYNSISASAIGWTLWIFLIKEEETTVVAASSLIVPMIALIFGWLLLREIIEIESIIGFILILAGVYLVNKRFSNKRLKEQSAG